MAAPLDVVELPSNGKVEAATMAEVGAVNDRAYGSAAGVIALALGDIHAADIRGYGIRVDGELASVASIIDVDQDAFVTMVATVPDHRGKHLASTSSPTRSRRRGDVARPPRPCRPRSSARASMPASATARSVRSICTRSGRQ